MTLPELLMSLSGAERDYIAMTDYGNDVEKHREQLDIVIARGGTVDLETQYWFPYEVIELRKNQMEVSERGRSVHIAGFARRSKAGG